MGYIDHKIKLSEMAASFTDQVRNMQNSIPKFICSISFSAWAKPRNLQA